MLKSINNYVNSKIKEPEDVYSSIHPLFCICNLVGLAPYSQKKIDGKNTFVYSLGPIVRSGILVAVFLGIFGFTIYYTDTSFYSTSQIKDKVRYFQEVFNSILSMIEIIISCAYATKIIEVYKNIIDIDTQFKILAVWVSYKEIYIRLWIHLIVLILCNIFLITFGILVTQVHSENPYIIVMGHFSRYFPIFVNILMEMQYFHSMGILKLRYTLLNDYLESMVERNNFYNGWIDPPISSISKKSAEKLNSSKNLPKSLISITDPVFIIDQVATLHIKLTDTAQLINTAFCVQQLLRVTVAFVSIVTALFSIAMNFSASSNSEDVEMDSFFTLWAFSNAIEVVMIVWITSETCEEANSCPRILHKIRNNTSNMQLQDTIEIYSLQMCHNKLAFTVCGLFPLDYTLLYTIVAGVTTYLVILIQFNIEFVQKTNTTISTTVAPATFTTIY